MRCRGADLALSTISYMRGREGGREGWIEGRKDILGREDIDEAGSRSRFTTQEANSWVVYELSLG